MHYNTEFHNNHQNLCVLIDWYIHTVQFTEKCQTKFRDLRLFFKTFIVKLCLHNFYKIFLNWALIVLSMIRKILLILIRFCILKLSQTFKIEFSTSKQFLCKFFSWFYHQIKSSIFFIFHSKDNCEEMTLKKWLKTDWRYSNIHVLFDFDFQWSWNIKTHLDDAVMFWYQNLWMIFIRINISVKNDKTLQDRCNEKNVDWNVHIKTEQLQTQDSVLLNSIISH